MGGGSSNRKEKFAGYLMSKISRNWELIGLMDKGEGRDDDTEVEASLLG